MHVLIRYEEPDQDVVEMRDWFDDDGGVDGELEHSQDSPILAVLRKKVEQGLISQAEYVCPHAHQNLFTRMTFFFPLKTVSLRLIKVKTIRQVRQVLPGSRRHKQAVS